MAEDTCWYENCRAPGSLLTIDGHTRRLCPIHERGIQAALQRPDTYRVSWGRSNSERAEALQSEIERLQAELAQLLSDPAPDEPPDSWSDERWDPSPEEDLEDKIAECEGRLEHLSDDHRENPTVRVNVITDAEPKAADRSKTWRPPA